MKGRLRLLVTLILVAAFLAAGAFLIQRTLSPAPHLPTGVTPAAQPALMALRLPDADGTEHSLSDWQGQVLVVNFWATWCPPCIKEIPEFSAASRHYAGQAVQFVGLSIDTADNVRKFRDRFEVPYPLLIGGNDTLQLATEFGNAARALPFTVFVGPDGQLRDVKLGMLNERELRQRIDALLSP